MPSNRGQEGLAVAKELDNTHFVVYNLYSLGAATCGLNDFQASRNYLAKALYLAWETQKLDQVMNILFYFATLLVKKSHNTANPEQPDLQKKTQALELLVMVIHHSATWQPIKDRAARLQTQLEAELPADVVATANTHDQSKTLEGVVTELLQHEEP